jgi:hypothetical protein
MINIEALYVNSLWKLSPNVYRILAGLKISLNYCVTKSHPTFCITEVCVLKMCTPNKHFIYLQDLALHGNII